MKASSCRRNRERHGLRNWSGVQGQRRRNNNHPFPIAKNHPSIQEQREISQELDRAAKQKLGNQAGESRGDMEEPSVADPPMVFWKSRRRSASAANGRSLQVQALNKEPVEASSDLQAQEGMKIDDANPDPRANLSEKRKALFEPLEPIDGKRSSSSDVPPPDFEPVSYPKGWVVGKKRKLVNVDVVESMRRIAIHEMNRKVPSSSVSSCALLII